MSEDEAQVQDEGIKLFGEWSFDGIDVRDIGLKRYLNLEPVWLPHSGGRHEARRFRKSRLNIGYGGVVYRLAVDISPQRRIDIALRFIVRGIKEQTFGNRKTLEEIVADQLIGAANNDGNNFAIRRKHEVERVALSSR